MINSIGYFVKHIYNSNLIPQESMKNIKRLISQESMNYSPRGFPHMVYFKLRKQIRQKIEEIDTNYT